MYYITILTLLAPIFAFSVELEPIVYASKVEQGTDEITSTVELIEKKQLQRSSGARLTSKLESNSSLEVSQTGVNAGQASVFIRGLDAKYTVFAINGVRIYDAASIQKILNSSTLNSSQIEKIEILKGAQSVLYGSDAIGGVVNIITRKEDLDNTLTIEHGIYSAYEVSQSVLYGSTLFNFSGFYQEDLNHNDLTVGSEKDKKINKGVSVEVSYGAVEWESETQLKLSNDFVETDGQDFLNDLPFDAKNNHVDTTQFFGTQRVKYHENKNSTYVLDLGVQNSNRLNKIGDFKLSFNGEVRQAELKWIGEELLVGGAFVQEIYSDDEISGKELKSKDIFTQISKTLGTYSMELGSRVTSNEFYGEHLVYNVGVSKKITTSKTLTLSQKTGFSAPSTYQLFGKSSGGATQDIGNEDLSPEKSVSVEINYEYKIKKISSSISLFQTTIENHIDFRNNRYENIDGSFSQGLEYELSYTGTKHFGAISLSLIDYDLSSGDRPERRAGESIKVRLGTKLSDTSEASLNYRYTGTRFEDIAGRSEILSAYSVVDFNYSKNYGDFRFALDIENIFDKVYEEAFLYATPRFGVQGRVVYTY